MGHVDDSAVSQPLHGRANPDLSALAPPPGNDEWWRRGRLLRLVFSDRRVAALLTCWYAALVLGWQPGLAGAISMIVLAPLWLVLGALGCFFLPENLLANLQLELPRPWLWLYVGGHLALLAGLHVWLYFTWRWAVLALIALLLCGSSYGCYANLGW